MENEIIERVAQAISKAPGMPYIGVMAPFRAAARCAFEAMREPTEQMRAAGLGRARDLIAAGTSTDYTVGETWQAVIDAALAEPQP